MSTALLGGGAAGCMLALRLHELLPHERIVIFERSGAPLAKVRATGGGRCNVTNTFADVAETADVYPRGARLMSRLLRATPPESLMALWESLGVALRVEAEGRVFPASQQSATVVDALLSALQRGGVEWRTHSEVHTVAPAPDGTFRLVDRHGAPVADAHFDHVAVTCGGLARPEALAPWEALGHAVEAPCPSLFGLRLDAPALAALSGVSVNEVCLSLRDTKIRARGPLLLTRQGVSGPGVLRLSAFGARVLAAAGCSSVGAARPIPSGRSRNFGACSPLTAGDKWGAFAPSTCPHACGTSCSSEPRCQPNGAVPNSTADNCANSPRCSRPTPTL